MTVLIPDRAGQACPERTPRQAAVVIALSWLPALVLAAFLPRYVPVFDHWPSGWGEPPALTHALMAVGRLGTGPVAVAGVVLVAALAGGGAAWVWAGLAGRRVVVPGLALAGLAAFALCLAGTLGQVITAPVVPMR
jgi:hypothetical protein